MIILSQIVFFIAEVVLSVLIQSFEFTPSKKEIFWRMAPVRPVVVGEGKESQLPLVVKLVQPAANGSLKSL